MSRFVTILSFLVTLCLSRLFSSAFVTFVTHLLRESYVLKINVSQWWRGFNPPLLRKLRLFLIFKGEVFKKGNW